VGRIAFSHQPLPIDYLISVLGSRLGSKPNKRVHRVSQCSHQRCDQDEGIAKPINLGCGGKDGAQGIVPRCNSSLGGPKRPRLRNNPMQSKLAMHQISRCGARTPSGNSCQSPAMANRRCRMHGGSSPGAPKGNRNAYKHGHYTAETIERRREIAALLRAMRVSSAEAW